MKSPPRLAAALLRAALPSDTRGRTIAGDLLQEFEEKAARHGRLWLWCWYWAQALELGGRYILFRLRAAAARRHPPQPEPPSDRDAIVAARELTREEAMENIWTDLRYGMRMLARTPTLSIVSILTIGLGIGLVTFAFSVVYGAVLRPLPVRDPDRLVAISETEPARGNWGMWAPMADYVEFRDQSTVFEELAAGYTGTVNLASDDGPPTRFDGAFVTANGLSILGVPPHLGRTFQPGEDEPGVEGTAVLGYDVWRNRFGAAESVVGQTVRINGESVTIIGVMPPGFRFPFDQEIWLTNRRAWEGEPRRDSQWVQPYGHLREGITLETAGEEVAMIADRMADEFPATNEGIGAEVEPYAETFMPPEITAVLWLMLGATIGVMLIACANVANLLLARAALRTRDVAIRSALGASRFRVIRQLLTEALILGALGGIVGLILAYVGTDLFNAAVANIEKPYWISMSVDVWTLAFTAAITLVAAVAAGVVPALRASGAAVSGVLQDDSRGSSSLRIGRLSGALVVGELVVSCALLVAAGFMVQSIVNTRSLELGFEPEGLMTARVGLFETEYPTRDDRQQFFRRLREALEDRPEVSVAALTTSLPPQGAPRWPFAVDGEAYETDAAYPEANVTQVSAGYFETMRTALSAGRELRDTEWSWSPAMATEREPVAIVNESFVERFLGDGDPLGRRLRVGTGDSTNPWMRIVGVVEDQFVGGGVGGIGNDQIPPQHIYYSFGDADVRFASMVLRGNGAPEGLIAAAREAVARIDPTLPIYWSMPMRQVLVDNSWAISLFGSLFTIFGVAALFLASVGLYGVMSFAVAQRRQEMGVRMALGAESADILRIVFRRVAMQLTIGLGAGVGLAYLLSGPLRFVMFGVETTDVGVYAAVVAVLALTGIAATLLPAYRAASVDPVTALRQE